MNTDDQNLSTDSADGQSLNSTQFTIHPNILNKYASYTYNISLQVTTTIIWNEMVRTQKYDSSQWATILKSGGVGPIKASRPAFGNVDAGTKTYFNRDLFINDLDFTTIVGNTQETRGTNVTSLTFKITEPNGMSFLEELYDFCHDEEGLNENNYTQLPYMLVINFSGYDDNGTLISNIGTKYIPLTILNIDIKVSSLAAIYDCQAIPHNEQSFTDKNAWVDHNVTLKGSTVQNYLDDLTTACNSQQQALVQNGIYEYPDTYYFKALTQTADPNDGNLTLVDLGSSLISYTDIAKKDAPMSQAAAANGKINIREIAQNYLSYRYLDNAQPNTNVINTSNACVQFTAGGTIPDWLNNLVISSEYITRQVRWYEQQVNFIQEYANTLTGTTEQQEEEMKQKLEVLNVPFQWFKIICDNIQYGPYDSKRNTYSRSYTYTIKPYIVDNSRSSIASSAIPKVRVLKAYNYILTGKNIDVMDFDINFKYAFINFLQFNSGTKRLGSGASTPTPDTNNQTNNSATGLNVSGSTPVVTPVNAAQSNVGSAQSNKKIFGTGVASEDRVRASDVMSTLYSKEDLLTLDLKILGDPDYIKQDEIMYQPIASLTPYAAPGTAGATGILFDAGEIYFQMNFLIPKDYDLDTGLMNVNSINNPDSNVIDYKRNMFSGLYAIITVSNQFSDGRFTQTLSARKYDDSNTYTEQNAAVS